MSKRSSRSKAWGHIRCGCMGRSFWRRSMGRSDSVKDGTSNIQHRTSNIERGEERRPKYDLEERLLEYAARIVRLVEQLPRTRAGNHVAKQLLRSGTSPLPN